MSLDREKGELLEGLGADYRIASVAKWAEMSKVMVPYEIKREGKWPQKANRPVFEDAIAKATETFMKDGAMWPVLFPPGSILVQEYPAIGQVAFIFQRDIRGETKYVTLSYNLGPEVIGWLKATNRWPVAA